MNQKEFDNLLHLSPRELEVFSLMGNGKTTKEIARQLKLSVKTVESHKTHISVKTGIGGAFAVRNLAMRFVIFCDQNRLRLVPVVVPRAPKLKFQPA